MPLNKEIIKLSETQGSTLPLGYQKMVQKKIPSWKVDKKIANYNTRYAHLTFQAMQSLKPISKIVK